MSCSVQHRARSLWLIKPDESASVIIIHSMRLVSCICACQSLQCVSHAGTADRLQTAQVRLTLQCSFQRLCNTSR